MKRRAILFFVLTCAFMMVAAACMTIDVQVGPAVPHVDASLDGSFSAVTRKLGSLNQPTPKTWSYTSGVADGAAGGTPVTVPALTYVTGVGAHSIVGGTLTIASGIGNMDAGDAGSTITIPANQNWNLFDTGTTGSLYGLGPGTVFTFTNVDTYTITYTTYPN